MSDALSQYSIGDWVVHLTYGVGQIKKIENKPIHGKSVKCFRVKTKDGAFWFPKNPDNNPRIRPISSKDTIKQVREELQIYNGDLDLDRKMWKNRIKEVYSRDNLIEISQLVRDLTILKTQRKLNQTEEKALNNFTDRLILEWSTSLKRDIETIRKKLNNYLNPLRKRAGA
jgi:RNA polymerase-interacting CarD/CdnL/TRCF family regulator